MGSKRIWAGLALGMFCIAPGCANVVGLGDFTVAGSGGAGTSKGSDMSGAPSMGGSAGHSGVTAGANNGAQAGLSADAGSAVDAGSGGQPDPVCATNCDDENECTDDICEGGKCVNVPNGAGKACGTGLTCDAQGVCVRCRDTAAGTAKDEGCTAGAPICVGLGAAAACSGCTTNTDCNDGNDCTSETCSNGSCAFSPVAAGQACATGVCNGTSGAERCVKCTDQPLITASTTVGNGGFEAVTVVNGTDHEAKLWDNVGEDYVIYSCAGGCKSSAAPTPQNPGGGNYIAWFAGTTYAATDELQQPILLPVGTTSLHIQLDTNVQTASKAASNADSFQVRLLDADLAPIGAAVATLSNLMAQTNTAAWTANGIDKTVDMRAQSGSPIYVDLISKVDATLKTDFFIDNVRVTATVCN